MKKFILIIFSFSSMLGDNLLNLKEFNFFNSNWQHHSKFAYRIFSVGAGVLNNSFTLSQYNRFSGSFLDDRAKNEILNSIPATGLWLNAGINLNGFDILLNNFGFSLYGTGSLTFRVPKDIFDLALYGNKLNRRYDADNLAVRTSSYLVAAISYHLVTKNKICVFGSVRYLNGIYHFETIEVRGYLFTTPSLLISEGNATYRLGRGGNGVGLDLNINYHFSSNLRLNIAVINLNSGINWADNPETGNRNFTLDSINWYRVRHGDFFQSSSTVISNASFRTPLPFYILFGSDYQINPVLKGKLLLSQSFNETALTARPPLFTANIEFLGLAVKSFRLPIELEVSLGGREEFGVGYSLGVIFKKFSGTFAVKDLSGFFLSAKGSAASLTFGYNLYPEVIQKPYVLRLRGD